jgi:hypothetical protein
MGGARKNLRSFLRPDSNGLKPGVGDQQLLSVP